MTPRTVELTFPANARYLVLARLSLSGIAPLARLDSESLADLKLAVTEACANAVRHAYPDGGDGAVRLRLTLEPGTLVVEVADDGKGLEASDVRDWDATAMREHGMGLAIMRSVVDEVEIDSAPESGTVVRLLKRLSA